MVGREYTEARLKEIKERLEAVSPGPWCWIWGYKPPTNVDEPGAAYKLINPTDYHVLRPGQLGILIRPVDAEFIARARDDIEWLCNLVEKLLDEHDELVEELTELLNEP